MNFKKWLTLVELIIVIIIIWVVSASLKNMFTYKNVTRTKYDTCYLHINSSISNFFQQALLQKQVYTWNAYKSVKDFEVIFDKNNQTISLVYSWPNVEKQFVLKWNFVDHVNDCHNIAYHTYLSGENLKVMINPWLNPDVGSVEWIWMTLYTGSNFNNKLKNWATWAVYLYYCPHVWTVWCLEKNKIEVDTRTALFKSYFCQSLDMNTGKCKKWSE